MLFKLFSHGGNPAVLVYSEARQRIKIGGAGLHGALSLKVCRNLLIGFSLRLSIVR